MLQKIRLRLNKLLPLIILIILPFLLFYPIFQGKIVVTGDFSGSDLLDLHLPFKYALHEAYKNFTLPLWEKNLAMGFPLLAEGQSGPLYPVNVALGFINPADSLNLSVIFVFVISLITSYLFFRASDKSWPSSLYGAIIFAFSGYFVTRFKHLNLVNVASLFPLLLFSAKKYFATGKNLFIILSSLTFAFMVFAGHPQIAIYNAFIFLLYCVYLAINKSSSNKTSALSGFANIVVTTAFLGILLSAVQIIPTIELTFKSPRSEVNEYETELYPFKPIHLMTFISPYYFGNPAEGTYTGDVRSFGIFWENTAYISLSGIIFALILIVRILIKKNKNRDDTFFLILAIFSLLLMMGASTPVFPTLFKSLPLMNLFRFPNRFNLYLIFSLVYLSIGGFDFIIGKIDKLKSNIADRAQQKKSDDESVQLNWPFSKVQTAFIIIAFTALDLFVFANAYISYLPKAEVTKEPEIAGLLKNGVYRTYNMVQYFDSPYSVMGWKKNESAILGSRKAIPPNNNLLYSIPSFTDRGWFEGGLSISRRNSVENNLLRGNFEPFVIPKVLGMYSVKYITSFSDMTGNEIYKEKEYDLGKDFASKLNLFRNDIVIPIISYLPEAEYLPDEKDVFKKMFTIEHNPAKTIILEDKPETLPEEFKGALDDFKKNNQISVITYENTLISLSADIKDHGFLLLNDTYYPGWRVFIDVKEGRILRANYLARAVELFPGSYRVKFIYDPLSFKIGAGISLATVSVLLLWGILTFFKKRLFYK